MSLKADTQRLPSVFQRVHKYFLQSRPLVIGGLGSADPTGIKTGSAGSSRDLL